MHEARHTSEVARAATSSPLAGSKGDSAGSEAEPVLTIVTVTYNTCRLVVSCLESVLEHTTTDPLEVIVVDNGSTDGTATALAERFPGVTVIQNERNLGAGAGYNQGMAAARGRLVLLLNSDTYVRDDVIGRAVRRMLDDPGVAVLGCELRYPDGRHQNTAFRRMSIRLSLLERLWLYKLLPPARREEALLGPYWQQHREVEADWLAGAFLLLRRQLFLEAGGLDTRFSFYGGEDSEWGIRLSGLGHRILYAPQLGVVYHVGSATAGKMWTHKEWLRRCHRMGIEVYATQHGRVRAGLYRGAELLGVAVRWLVYRTAATLRPNEYYASQAQQYRWLTEFYLAPREKQKG